MPREGASGMFKQIYKHMRLDLSPMQSTYDVVGVFVGGGGGEGGFP